MMSSMSGTARLIYSDIRKISQLMWLITLLLATAWIIFGITLDPTGFSTSISGPLYIGLFMVYPIIAITNTFKYAIGFGSTRIQYLKVFYGMGLLMVLINMFLFNVLYAFLGMLTERGILGFEFLHTGMMSSYNGFLDYVWIDIMAGLALFGITFFIAATWFRFGFIRFSIGFTVIAFIGYIFHVTVAYDAFIEWMFTLDSLVGFSLFGLIGLVLLFATFPLLRNAPLHYQS
ncbi:hypothetical protein ACSVDE_17665 [Pseudalkalibacillus sp. Hm43]|uniref:hypothetical protein n=1 Tax=Pseudalkalibacillus sp. Hm43 TaxID=3450742 RepID=UPI003F4281DB